MKKGLSWALVATIGLVWPAAVSACDSSLGYLFMRSYTQRFMEGGIQIEPGSDGESTYLIPTIDVSFPLNEGRAVVKPMIGLCTGDGTEIVFGGGGAVNFWNNPANTVALDAQVGLTAYSFDGGSEQTIPISVVGRLNSSGAVSFIFGAGFQVGHYSIDVGQFSDSGTDTDPFAVVGALLGSGDVRLQGGLGIKKGDSDTDIAINASVAVPFG